ncbi:MAG: transposase [Methanoregulaceae archaeon]
MRKTFKFRLFPTDGQRTKLKMTLEGCRRAYNLCLEARRDAYEHDGTTLTLYDTIRMVKDWRENDPIIGAVHTHPIQQTCERVHLAFQAFWRRCKSGEKPGYPRFKAEDRYDSFTFTDSNRGFSLRDESTLRISGVGDVRIKKHRPLDGSIKRLTVRRDGTGCWFACFSVEVEEKVLPPSHDAIGIDVGLESFATLSNGEVVENPRFFKRDQKRLAKLSRQVSESPVGSIQMTKKRKAHQKVWKRISNRRSDFAHKLSRQMVNRFGIICVEDLRIKQMMDGNFRSMNRSISDAAWGQFLQFTSYKAAEAGRVFVEVNPKNTSQICSGCGEMVPKGLGDRIHSCPHCGFTSSRDYNASLNILRRGLSSLAKSGEAA